jgi:putative ABC transport system substrate-binding protein
MNRRQFSRVIGGAAAWPLSARAQRPERVRRIGFLRVGPPPPAFIQGFQQGLRESGLVEGQQFAIEYLLTQNAEQMPHAAAELIGRNIDVLVASGTPSVLPAKNAAGTTPVVFIATLDPVSTGLVASLAKPGGNITGMTSISGDLIAKRLELVRELLPNLDAIAILVRASSPTTAQYVKESQAAARILDIKLEVLTERDPTNLEQIFLALRAPTALIVADDAEFTDNRTKLAELALKNRIPTVFGLREMVQAGGLIAYGASFGDLYRRAAHHVYKILQGISPADLPIEQPTRFELVLNMRTAKALNLSPPPMLLARADEVIE